MVKYIRVLLGVKVEKKNINNKENDNNNFPLIPKQ